MDIKEYIVSGILELYVAGSLSAKENEEVHKLAMEHDEIKAEIEAIEAAILELSNTVSPQQASDFETIRKQILTNDDARVIDIQTSTPWIKYTGWAASLLLLAGLFWMYNQNQELQSEIQIAKQENQNLEEQIAGANTSLEKSKELLNTLRDKNIDVFTLSGQPASPNSYAKAYWNKASQKVFIDAKGLPEPPEGMVYQVWSLKLSPLTPVSLGTLEEFVEDENKVFALDNSHSSEAFGITLEPDGGSESPTLEQLYTLGTVTAP